MECHESVGRTWKDIDTDILVKIFESFNIFELTSGIAHVCRTWRLACSDPMLWKTLDLTLLESNYIKIPLEPYVYVDRLSDQTLTRVLKIALSLSRGNVHTLIFHLNLYLPDHLLTYTAERSPQLRRLVLPAWNRIKKTGIRKAICTWKNLESMTMPSIKNPPYLMETIARNCKNFSELKIMGPCDIHCASTLRLYLPKLKVLSLRCSTLSKEALIIILDGLRHLEVLNISHCILVETSQLHRNIVTELDESILRKASRLRQFLTCMDESCIMCQRTRNDEGLMRWYKYEKGLWKEDEVSSLAL